MRLFDMDSPLMNGLNKMADLMILNLLTILCCLPVVTVGASLTAMHYMIIKLIRNEESYVVKGFFRSFKQNLRQGTIIWLLQLFVIIVLGFDYYLLFFTGTAYPTIFQIVLFVVSVVVLVISMFVYPILSKFDNTVLRTLKNAMFIGMLQLPKSILMALMFAVPVVIGLIMPEIIPIVLLFGITVPAYGGAKLYNKFFEKMENQMIAEAGGAPDAGEGDEHIFSDEPVIPDNNEV